MNNVDTLLNQPFHTLTLEEKLHVINVGPHQPRDFKLQVKNRSFCCNWYTTHEWLTVSLGKQKLFCFYCLLFTDPFETEKTWSSLGFKDLHHFTRSAKKHAVNESHLNNVIRFKTFGTGTTSIKTQVDSSVQTSVKRHNEKVDKSRQILNRIIDAITFCGVHELSPREHEKKTTYYNEAVLDLIKRLSTLDSQLEEHLNSATIEKYTSNTIQNELLDCIFEVYRQELYKDIQIASFVAVEAVEATDLSCCPQLVIILRFIKNKTPVERVLKCVDVKDRSAKGLANVLFQELKDLNVKEKLIAQAYDGAAVMSGSKGVHIILKQEFPNAHCIYAYAHQFNSILKKLTNHITKVRSFFTNLTGFATFFAVSPTRSDILRTVCSKGLPQPSQKRWNFQSRLIESVHEMRNKLMICFDEIIESSQVWDDTTVREAYGLRRLLNDVEFQYLLTFFYDIFLHVDILYNNFQEKVASGTKVASCVTDFVTCITQMRNSVQEPESEAPGRRKLNKNTCRTSLKAAVVEVCDVLTTELIARVSENAFLSAFCILNTKHFHHYRINFPVKYVNVIIDKYPFLSKQHLTTELRVVFRNQIFSNQNCPSLLQLYSTFLNTDLKASFTETIKLIEIVLTMPIATAEPDFRCFRTLKRVKTFLLSSMPQDRLNALATLFVHKEEIQNIPDFNQKVTQRFSERKNRRADFLYK